MHESSKMALQPKDFTKINKSLIKKSTIGENIQDKELRKQLDGIRKKVKKGRKRPEIDLPSKERIYGLASPKHEDIADLIYNTYGNKAEEDLKKNYEAFIAEKSKVYHRPKVVPRFINPKVEELKKKEEEKKANALDFLFEEEKKEPEKPLYKLKMFQNVGSKVTEGLKKFKTYKPSHNCAKEKKEQKIEKEEEGINKVIEDVKKDVEKKEEIEQIGNEINA